MMIIDPRQIDLSHLSGRADRRGPSPAGGTADVARKLTGNMLLMVLS
jgi:hypothetical protein